MANKRLDGSPTGVCQFSWSLPVESLLLRRLRQRSRPLTLPSLPIIQNPLTPQTGRENPASLDLV